MPTHNYICGLGHVETDVYYTNAGGGPDKTRTCPKCKKPATIHFGSFGAFNRLMSTQGHNQPLPDPQTGLYYDNATDKRKKLKALGLEETDRKTVGQVEAETWDARNRQVEQKARQEAIAADSMDEIMEKIDWSRVDREKSGDMRRNVESAGLFSDTD